MKKQHLHKPSRTTLAGLYLLMILALVVSLVASPLQRATAANPAPYETYFVPLPDDWLMQHMEDLDTDGGTAVGDSLPAGSRRHRHHHQRR